MDKESIMRWSNSKRSWASESICSVVRLFPGCEQEPRGGAPLLAVGESCYIDMELGKEGFSVPGDNNCLPSETPTDATFKLHTPNGGIYCLTN